MAKNDAELQALEQPKSRNEEYLNFLCGRAVDINSLPDKPYSRVEEYLEYLCYNRGQGGGGGQVPPAVPFITDAVLKDKIIEFTLSDGTTKEVSLDDFVKEWNDLKYVTESQDFNIFNPTTFIDGRYYGVNGVVVNNLNWGHFNIPCSAGETLTVFKKTYDSKNFGLLDSNVNWFNNLVVNSTTDGVWQKFTVNIPQDQRVVYLSVPVYKVDNNYRNEIMVFRGNVTAPAEFIPFTNNREISIDGEKVNISFDALTTTLSTNSVVDAIKELDVKVANVSTGIVTSVNGIQPVNGNVTITSSDIDYDNQTSQLASNNVKDAIDEVKNLIDLLQAKNTTTHFVDNNAEFEQLKQTIGTGFVSGDIVYVINSNGVVDHTNTDVDNDGKAISLIYDEKVTGFRVLSRDSEKINLKANLVTVEPTINGLNNVQDVLEYLEKDKASLNKNNVFIGHNTFNEVNLLGKTPFAETDQSAQLQLFTIDKYCGYRMVSTGQQQRHVSAIRIVVDDNLAVGSEVKNVYVVEIEKRNSRVDDIVRDKITEDGSFIVEEDNGTKVIYIPVEKTYTNDTYFLIGKKGDYQFKQSRYVFQNDINQCVNGLDIENLPQKDSTLNHDQGNGWIIIHSLLTNDINVRDELDLLKNKVSNAVTSVNKETPIDGDVTVNAEHIGYDGNTSNIIATNVQDAIDKLKEDVALIDGAEIFIVTNKTELEDLLNRSVVRHGDLIYIINSTDVVDYTGQNVNGGNPVAMIYDNTITGNKLRVFSKFSSTVHITAKNVEYDDAQTQLTAQNVQEAIGKLNEKIANAGTGTVKSVNGQVPNQQNGNVAIDGTHINATVGIETLNIQEHLGRMNNKVIQAEADAQMARSEVNVLTNYVNANVINKINGHDTSINSLNGTTNDHSTRIRALERKVPTPKVGELIQTFANGGNSYSQGGIEYIWLGRTNNTVQRGRYPELFNVFGIASASNAFDLPYIQDQSVQFDYGKTISRKTYIVAKVSN